MRNSFRIVGGRWRARRVRFPHREALRPTPDRVRVTLFNWLRPELAGARCLDLFAGSGALGLEALSQGAARVVFVDDDRVIAGYLRRALAELGFEGGTVKCVDADRYLRSPPQRFDVVFLDPPYDRNALPGLCTLLEQRGWLAPSASIYLEHHAGAAPPSVPDGWSFVHSKRAGRVGYHLCRRRAGQHRPETG